MTKMTPEEIEVASQWLGRLLAVAIGVALALTLVYCGGHE